MFRSSRPHKVEPKELARIPARLVLESTDVQIKWQERLFACKVGLENRGPTEQVRATSLSRCLGSGSLRIESPTTRSKITRPARTHLGSYVYLAATCLRLKVKVIASRGETRAATKIPISRRQVCYNPAANVVVIASDSPRPAKRPIKMSTARLLNLESAILNRS